MNAIVIMLLIGLIGTLWLQWWLNKKKKEDAAPPAPPVIGEEGNLAKLVEMMREDREEKARAEREKELLELAKVKHRDQPPVPIQSSLLHEDRPIRSDGDYIPYGLSADEKRILKEFYG
jgi:hypothetical protein